MGNERTEKSITNKRIMNTIELTKDPAVPFDKSNLISGKNKIAQRVSYPRSQGEIKFFGNPSKDVVYHEGYLGYLSKAWCNHYSVVIRPDDIWFMILNELTAEISKSPDQYSSMFTKTPGEKSMLLVRTNNPETINPELIIDILKDMVPTKVDDFMPKFSTSTKMCNLAMNVAFCDMVSPYYSYGTLLCGIPKVKVEGTVVDWNLMLVKLETLTNLFKGNLNIYLKRCLGVVSDLILATKNLDSNHFKKMVKLEMCGSGSQYEMSGWIMHLINCKNFKQKTQLEGLPPHFTHMDYTNIETQRKFSLYCGLFYSKVDAEFLVPEYDAFRFEILPEKKVKEKVEYVVVKGENSEPQGLIYAPYIPKYRS